VTTVGLMGVQIVGFARWEDGVPSETLYAHFEIDALVPRRYHQFSRRIPVNAAKRTDRKKKKRKEEYIPSGSTCNSGTGSRAQRFGVQWRTDHRTSNPMDPTETPG